LSFLFPAVYKYTVYIPVIKLITYTINFSDKSHLTAQVNTDLCKRHTKICESTTSQVYCCTSK